MAQGNIVGTESWRVLRLVIAVCCLSGPMARAQQYDITPLVGARFGGTINLEEAGVPNFKAHLVDSINFGIAAGYRFDGDDCEKCNVVEFRWLRQDTHVAIRQDPLAVTPYSVAAFRPAVTQDDYLADFTHEFSPHDVPYVKPFVTVSLGAGYLSGPASGTARFVFGLGTGIKIFPARNWGVRVQLEYLPTVLHAELQTLVCTGGCVVVLSGGLLNQFNVTIGPTFRF